MESLLHIGRIVGTHGVKGEVNVFPLTDDPKRFSILKDCFLTNEKNTSMADAKAVSARYFKNKVILKLDGVDDCDSALALKGRYIAVSRENAVKLQPGSYFICDLIGCTVMDDVMGELGTLIDVLETGANDIYIVKRKKSDAADSAAKKEKDLLIPAIKQIVKNVDITSRIITVHLMEGLLDL